MRVGAATLKGSNIVHFGHYVKAAVAALRLIEFPLRKPFAVMKHFVCQSLLSTCATGAVVNHIPLVSLSAV